MIGLSFIGEQKAWHTSNVSRTEGSVNERRDWLVSVGDQGRPARLVLILNRRYMGLDLFPSLTFYYGAHLPAGLETIVAFDARVVSHLLEELGEMALWTRLHESMAYDEAREFAEELDTAADRLDRERRQQHPKSRGSYRGNAAEDERPRAWVEEMSATYEEAVDAIRAAACWYRQVGQLELDVKASI